MHTCSTPPLKTKPTSLLYTLEPTSALDEDSCEKVEKTLGQLNCLWVTHNPQQAHRINTAGELVMRGGDNREPPLEVSIDDENNNNNNKTDTKMDDGEEGTAAGGGGKKVRQSSKSSSSSSSNTIQARKH